MRYEQVEESRAVGNTIAIIIVAGTLVAMCVIYILPAFQKLHSILP